MESPDRSKDGENWIKVGVVMQLINELLNADISGGAVEFKMAMGQDPSGNIPQAISNMVRAASNLLVDAITNPFCDCVWVASIL